MSSSCSPSPADCTLVLDCQQSIPNLYLPCRSYNNTSDNKVNSNGCLYCFKELAPGFKIPKTSVEAPTETLVPDVEVTSFSAASVPSLTLEAEPHSSYINSPTSSSSQPPISTNAPVSFNNANSSNAEKTTTIVLSSTLIPILIALLVGLVVVCKRRKKDVKTIHIGVLPSQDTLQDFDGALDEIEESHKLPFVRANMDDLPFNKGYLLRKAVSEKTIDGNQEVLKDDIDLLKATDFSLSMHSINIPNVGRKLKPFSAPTKELLSKNVVPELLTIPSLQIEKKSPRNMGQVRSNSGFEVRPSIVHENLQEVHGSQDTNVNLIEKMVVAGEGYNMVSTKRYGGFEKRQSAGGTKFDLDDESIIIEDDV